MSCCRLRSVSAHSASAQPVSNTHADTHMLTINTVNHTLSNTLFLEKPADVHGLVKDAVTKNGQKKHEGEEEEGLHHLGLSVVLFHYAVSESSMKQQRNLTI